MTEQKLRSLIRQILESSAHDVGNMPKDKDAKKKKPKNLLTEPDSVKDRASDKEEENEVSAGGVPGVVTPLGAGPHYPAPESPAVKRIKKQIDVVGRAYGGAKPSKKKNK